MTWSLLLFISSPFRDHSENNWIAVWTLVFVVIHNKRNVCVLSKYERPERRPEGTEDPISLTQETLIFSLDFDPL